MSTLKADTIVAADGTSPVTLTKQSAAKAWVNFDGTGTIAARDSLNLSSLTDVDTGRYTISKTNSMSDTNYCKLAYSGVNDTVGTSRTYNPEYYSTATGSISLATYSTTNWEDHAQICTKIHGDLA